MSPNISRMYTIVNRIDTRCKGCSPTTGWPHSSHSDSSFISPWRYVLSSNHLWRRRDSQTGCRPAGKPRVPCRDSLLCCSPWRVHRWTWSHDGLERLRVFIRDIFTLLLNCDLLRRRRAALHVAFCLNFCLAARVLQPLGSFAEPLVVLPLGPAAGLWLAAKGQRPLTCWNNTSEGVARGGGCQKAVQLL